MRFRTAFAAIALVAAAAPRLASGTDVRKKAEAAAAVDKHQAELIGLADRVWAFAETALRETRSAAALADYAESQGFHVVRGVAGLPTAFTASYGQGRPIIGILGEYDALPGLSQKAQTTREPIEAGAPGHGCGHNLFGAASLGAAVAVKEMIAGGRLQGTVRFYGTPAEEAVGGKIYMAREGAFNDLDVCLTWHPGEETKTDVDSSQAIADFVVEFHGKAAHAAFDPWNGRSAVAGLEFFAEGLNRLREFVKPTVRMHYAILNGGNVPNVVPEYAKIWCYVRDSKRAGVDELVARARKIAEGAALMAGVEATFTVQGGDYETLVNLAGEKLVQANLAWLGPVPFSPEDQAFAREIQRTLGLEPKGLDGAVKPWKDPKPDPEGGSTDVGDVSWLVPVLGLNVTTAPWGAPWHAWPVVACGGMSVGHSGMAYAAKILAATMVDLFESPETVKAVRAEFLDKTKGFAYRPSVPDGPPPLPKR